MEKRLGKRKAFESEQHAVRRAAFPEKNGKQRITLMFGFLF